MIIPTSTFAGLTPVVGVIAAAALRNWNGLSKSAGKAADVGLYPVSLTLRVYG
jgi:hypothetical protein